MFAAAMEAVLDLYALPPDPLRPLVCLDEFSKQLLSEVAPPLPAAPGRVRREDAEYVREGSASAFMIAAPHLGIRQVHIGPDGRRTAADFADAVRFLCDEMFPDAVEIRLVMDNLNTHNAASLYASFAPEEANRLASKLSITHTPKHGSWLNMAEFEISALARAALDGRIADLETFRAQIDAYLTRKNAEPAPANWKFTAADAREKLAHVYPAI